MLMLWFLSLVLLKLVSCESHTVFNRIQDGQMIEYYWNETHVTYQESLSYCKSLGGSLPILRSQDDLKFWRELGEVSGTMTMVSYLGLVKTNGKCNSWIDGSPFTLDLALECDACEASCCALIIGQILTRMLPCADKAPQTCVVVTDGPEEKNGKLELGPNIDGNIDSLNKKHDKDGLSLLMKIGETHEHSIAISDETTKLMQTYLTEKEEILHEKIASQESSSLSSSLKEQMSHSDFLAGLASLREKLDKIRTSLKIEIEPKTTESLQSPKNDYNSKDTVVSTKLETHINESTKAFSKMESISTGHEKMLKQHSKELESFSNKSTGMITRLTNLEDAFEKINKTITDVVNRPEEPKAWWDFKHSNLYALSLSGASMLLLLIILTIIAVRSCKNEIPHQILGHKNTLQLREMQPNPLQRESCDVDVMCKLNFDEGL